MPLPHAVAHGGQDPTHGPLLMHARVGSLSLHHLLYAQGRGTCSSAMWWSTPGTPSLSPPPPPSSMGTGEGTQLLCPMVGVHRGGEPIPPQFAAAHNGGNLSLLVAHNGRTLSLSVLGSYGEGETVPAPSAGAHTGRDPIPLPLAGVHSGEERVRPLCRDALRGEDTIPLYAWCAQGRGTRPSALYWCVLGRGTSPSALCWYAHGQCFCAEVRGPSPSLCLGCTEDGNLPLCLMLVASGEGNQSLRPVLVRTRVGPFPALCQVHRGEGKFVLCLGVVCTGDSIPSLSVLWCAHGRVNCPFAHCRCT